MSYGTRRDTGYPSNRRFNPFYGNTVTSENYIHETVMYLVSILDGEPNTTMDLSRLTVELCKRGNTKPLKKVASGDSVEERVLAFVWQHPTIFQTKERVVSLRSIHPDIDDELECCLEDRIIEFIVFRCNQYGPCQIPISKLLGNLHQAANDIKLHFHNDYSRFYNFLRYHDDIFTLIDSETVALKSVHDQAVQKNKSLLKCDEYDMDSRVLKCTKMVTTFEEGMVIVQEIMNTKEIVAIDCEGVNLGAPFGYITLVQLAILDDLPEDHTDDDIVDAMKIYLFDVQEDSDLLFKALRKLLRSSKVTKIFQGCSSDATALYNRYKIITESVFDTVIAHRHLHEGAKSDLYYLYEFYVGEETNRMKKDIKKMYISNPQLWTTRPLDELLTYYAAFDVFALIRIFYKLKSQIDTKTYNEIHSISSNVALHAYLRKLPLAGAQMYGKGYTTAQIHAELGFDLDSDEEAELGIENKGREFYPHPRQYPVNGQSNHPPPFKQSRPPRGRGGSDTRSTTFSQNYTSSQQEFKNNTRYYQGNALYQSSYNNQRRRPNHYNHQGRPDRFQRPQLPQNNAFSSANPQIRQQTNHYVDNSTQRTYNNHYRGQPRYHSNPLPQTHQHQNPYQYRRSDHPEWQLQWPPLVPFNTDVYQQRPEDVKYQYHANGYQQQAPQMSQPQYQPQYQPQDQPNHQQQPKRHKQPQYQQLQSQQQQQQQQQQPQPNRNQHFRRKPVERKRD